MPSREQMRAADGDREAVAVRLREALDEGRLSLDELDNRLREAYAAKTFGDLDRLIADLPPTRAPERSQLAPVTGMPVPPSRGEESPRLPGWLALLWRLWVAVVLLNVVIWFLASLASGQVLYFWPIWVAGPWGAANVGLTILFPPRRPG